MTSEPADSADGALLGHELSLWVVLYHDAVAARMGVNATEHKVLDIIARQPGVTPTWLVEVTGLSASGVTKIVNRLVELDWVQRSRDSSDERRFFLAVTVAHQREMACLYEPMADAMNRLADTLDAAERQAVARWVVSATAVLRQATRSLVE